MSLATYILILFAHVGALGDGNSKQTCEQAGASAKTLARGTVKIIDFVCVPK